MKHGKKCVEDGIEMFRADCRKNDDLDPLVLVPRVPDIVGSTVNGDIVAAGGQSDRELFGKRFKPAVVRRYSPRAEDGQLHRRGL